MPLVRWTVCRSVFSLRWKPTFIWSPYPQCPQAVPSPQRSDHDVAASYTRCLRLIGSTHEEAMRLVTAMIHRAKVCRHQIVCTRGGGDECACVYVYVSVCSAWMSWILFSMQKRRLFKSATSSYHHSRTFMFVYVLSMEDWSSGKCERIPAEDPRAGVTNRIEILLNTSGTLFQPVFTRAAVRIPVLHEVLMLFMTNVFLINRMFTIRISSSLSCCLHRQTIAVIFDRHTQRRTS